MGSMAAASQSGLLSRKTVSKLGATFNEAAADTSMDFGRRMLAKFGWSEGKGLGKQENGMKDHIRVKQRADLLGLGANDKPATAWAPPPEEVAAAQKALAKKRKREKKEAKAAKAAAKAAGAGAGGSAGAGASDSDSDESDGEREVRRRLQGSGVIGTVSDEALFELCGGARLHRGSRSGTGEGKVSRTAAADAAFLAKYGGSAAGAGADVTAAPDAAAKAVAACADEAAARLQAKKEEKAARRAEKEAKRAAAATERAAAEKAERKAAKRARRAEKEAGK